MKVVMQESRVRREEADDARLYHVVHKTESRNQRDRSTPLDRFVIVQHLPPSFESCDLDAHALAQTV